MDNGSTENMDKDWITDNSSKRLRGGERVKDSKDYTVIEMERARSG